ncbi:hypothetical protein Ae201684P_000751 [Aphanomyces euteiches]|uniref:Serine aminopeptidase S33 domain-containing protein n=1 Tax=Aphanomyces euteiches TaxID=100861 RepID=A0A6G0XR82_9STRA|nr:hypothetical protein Ae201684_002122 [Aphanomyces euteiches]KAH9087340.1 hypothetical protein Ae201684P_000751 [Aphanomyces euteiches]
MSFWNSPLITSVAFHPRPHAMNSALVPNAIDGTFTSSTISLGYRFYRPSSQPDSYESVILLFHGNAEIAPDYDSASKELSAMKSPAALLVVDYRGYGWSSGEPSLTSLLSDAELVASQLGSVPKLNPSVPVVLFGRSLGSQCAIHLANKFPDRFSGLVLESSFHAILQLPSVKTLAMMLPGGAGMLNMLPEIFHSLDKIKHLQSMPVMVIHGTDDEIAPLEQAKELFQACSSTNKKFQQLPNAGHNDLVHRHRTTYYAALEILLKDAITFASASSVVQECNALLLSKQYDAVVVKGVDLLQSDRLSEASQCLLLEYVAKASWHKDDMNAVVKYSTRLLNRQPNHINGLCLRAKAYDKLQDFESFYEDVLALSDHLGGPAGATKESTAMALLAIHCWTV